MRSPGVVVAVLLIFLCTVPCRAGVVPGRWEKVETLNPGSAIQVTLESGDEMECFFKSLGPEALLVADRDGRGRRIPKAEVERVVAPHSDDGAKNGVLIGLGVGAGIGLLSGIACDDNCNREAALVAWTAILGTVGALVGLGIDKWHKSDEVFYRAR